MTEVTPRQQRLAAVYDADIWPLVPERAAAAIVRALPRVNGVRVLEVGARTGRLTMQLAARADDASQVRAIEPSAALVGVAEEARIKAEKEEQERLDFLQWM